MKSIYDYDIETLEIAFEWRDIEDYEGLYKVSEYGDVMALNYNHTGKKKLLKQSDDGRGYLKVGLYKNGTLKKYKVHRLVATAFCEGASDFDVVNHMDEDKLNNHYTNLEWCTLAYNTCYSSHNNIITKCKKTVRCVELDMVFNSIEEASKHTGADSSCIVKCCKGKQKTAAGYHWEYA